MFNLVEHYFTKLMRLIGYRKISNNEPVLKWLAEDFFAGIALDTFVITVDELPAKIIYLDVNIYAVHYENMFIGQASTVEDAEEMILDYYYGLKLEF